jgi:hypothetical protein
MAAWKGEKLIMPEMDFINLTMAVAVTMAATEIIKRILKSAFGDGIYSALAPLVAVLAASVATAVLIDVTAADMQSYGLAVIVVAAISMGLWSGPKNIAEGVKRASERAS